MKYSDERIRVVETCRAMNASGINSGTSGNVSFRLDETHFLITPSGLDYEQMLAEHIVLMHLDGTFEGELRPSSEWRMHAALYRDRCAANAVLHCHAPYATALSCLRRSLPAFHYMVALSGAHEIKCADYALFGSVALSRTMNAALGKANTCLLANHGMICFAPSLPAVLALAVEIENLCRQYHLACALGQPVILSETEMQQALRAFEDYQRQS